MRSYEQYCAVARGLDVLGDRWTLLIVRELLALGPSRYSDLVSGLPGIPSNLLAERLKAMEQHGILAKQKASRPATGTLYALTTRGEALWPVLAAIGEWAGPLLATTTPDEEFRTHWLSVPARLHLHDSRPADPPVTLVLDTGEEPLTVTIGGVVTTTAGDHADADARLSGDPQQIVRTLVGARKPGEAGAATLSGNPDVFARATA